jgi:hypothetical protein
MVGKIRTLDRRFILKITNYFDVVIGTYLLGM